MPRLKPPPPLQAFLRRCFSTQHYALLPQRCVFSSSSPPATPLPPSDIRQCPPSAAATSVYSRCLQSYSIRLFSTQGNESGAMEEEKAIAEALSIELLKDPDVESLPLPQRLDRSFSHISVLPNLLRETLNLSPDTGWTAMDFLEWTKSRPGFQPSDKLYSYFVDYFGRRKDFKAAHNLLLDCGRTAGPQCFRALVDRLVRAGRPTQTVALFERMEADYGFSRSMDSLKLIVSNLCDHGYASYAVYFGPMLPQKLTQRVHDQSAQQMQP